MATKKTTPEVKIDKRSKEYRDSKKKLAGKKSLCCETATVKKQPVSEKEMQLKINCLQMCGGSLSLAKEYYN